MKLSLQASILLLLKTEILILTVLIKQPALHLNRILVLLIQEYLLPLSLPFFPGDKMFTHD